MISVAADVSEASGEGTERSVRTKAAKAAEDSRTPRRCRDGLRATPSASSWSAAVLCRFDLRSLAGCNCFESSAATEYGASLRRLLRKAWNIRASSTLGKSLPLVRVIVSSYWRTRQESARFDGKSATAQHDEAADVTGKAHA